MLAIKMGFERATSLQTDWPTGMRTVCFAITIMIATTATAHAQYYGAIAISTTTSSLGWAYNMPSRAAAETVAISKCGVDDCRVGTWFRNACGAVAIGDGGGWGASWGNTKNGAIERAINACSQNTENCEWKRVICTAR
jgi:serine/threonine-protein kinase